MVHIGTQGRFFRWHNLRWLIVVAAVPVAFAAFAIVWFMGFMLSQQPYFWFIDALHRVTPRTTDSLGVFLISTPVASLFFAAIIGAAVAIVSRRSRPFVMPTAISVSIVAAEVLASFFCGVPCLSTSAWVAIPAIAALPFIVTALALRRSDPSFAFRRIAPLAFVAAYVILCPTTIIANSRPAPVVRILKPVWQADIKPYGWSGWTNEDAFSATRRLTFLDSGTLSVGFEGDLHYESASDKMPKRPQHVLTLDAATGRVIAHKEWLGGFSYVFGTAHGKLVVAARGLELLSKTLEPIGTFSLPTGLATSGAPDGRRIAWERSAKDEPGVFLIDTADLKPATSLAAVGVLRTMSDSTIATGDNLVEGRSAVEAVDEHGRALLYQQPVGDKCGLSPHFLSNDVMLIIRCDHLMLFDTAQKRLVRDEVMGTHMDFGGVSRDGKRFVLGNSRWDFGDPAYLNREDIIVFDTATLRPVAKVLSDPLPRNQSWSALSPDGRLLATGSGGVVKLFRID